MSSHAQGLIAIIGMSCRFPGARNAEELWCLLRDGVETISFFSEEELRASGVDAAELASPDYVPARGIVEGVELFDAELFGFSPQEASYTDPQHRLFLECAWQALEEAGYDSQRYQGRIGVFGGSNVGTYLLRLLNDAEHARRIGGLEAAASDRDSLATRVSRTLNLTGPSLTVQVFGSTSAVAVHLAIRSLLHRDADMALAGGVSLDIPQKTGYHSGGSDHTSRDGHTRAFDARGTGTVPGEGVGLVVLKRLEEALADGDTIRAVIRGSAINHDGSCETAETASGIAARATAQANAVRAALAEAGVDPGSIQYVEAYGSATQLGDRIEVAALTAGFGSGTVAQRFCALGSVTTNIGYLGRAAGIASLLKVVLALENRLMPPSLGFETPNPELDLARSSFHVLTEARPWEGDGTRRAGVNCPGLGGTNVHLVLEEAPAQRHEPSRPWQVVVLSARTGTALESSTTRLAEFLRHHPEADLGDVAFTLQVGRRLLDHRRRLVCRDVADALSALEGSTAGRLETFVGDDRDRGVSFLLPGFGDHYPDMALGLYRDEPAFRRVVDDCCARLLPELGFDLREELFPGLAGGGPPTPAAPSAASRKLDLQRIVRGEGLAARRGGLTRMTAVHPAVVVTEYALAQLLMSWGIRPRAMIGYSLGEYAAACLAGVISLADCLTLVARRARMIEELPPGAMLAVPLPLQEIEPLLVDGLGIAVVNGPALYAVSGPLAAVEALEARLKERDVLCRRLSSSHAGHSAMMEPIAGRLRDLLAGFELRPPQIPYVSNVTGTWIRPEEATDPDYWVRHLCGRVLFSDGIDRLLAVDSVFLEVGPGQSLTAFAKQHLASGAARGSQMFSTLRSAYNAQPDRAFLLGTLGRLWMAGVPVDWPATHVGRRRRIPLPTYPFERQRYWLEPRAWASPRTQPAAPPADPAAAGSGRIHTWPNGMRIVAQTRTEAEHFYQDIFEKEIYRRHGIALREGACIFDVGANIGSFLLYAHQASRGALIHSFEPAPPLFEKLRRNAALNGVEARLFNFGLSDREGTAELTFYPRSSGMSSFHADKEQEKAVLRRMMEREREAGVAGVSELMSFTEEFLEERFRSESFECRLRPLSDVIEECEVGWIDLLKVDVQKAELEVLEGIREEHWPRIGQIVVEVHDLEGRLERIVRRLEERGFRVAVEQDDLLQDSVLYNLFAVREGIEPKAGVRERQRQAFLRAVTEQTAAASPPRPVFGTAYSAPGSGLERRLAEVWQRLLQVENIGLDDNFFDLGGTSLLGLQIVREIQRRFDVELSLMALFEAPTVRSLARDLDPQPGPS